MKTVIVSGGLGQRIRSLTGDDLPKALLPVAGRPAIIRQLEYLRDQGVRDVAVTAGFQGNLLSKKVKEWAAGAGLNVQVHIEPSPLGTAGGLSQLKNFLQSGDFFVLYGDMISNVDLPRMLAFHRDHRSLLTIAAHPNDHPATSDLLEMGADGRLIQVHFRLNRIKGNYHNLVPAALYCASPQFLDEIIPAEKQDFIQDIFPRLITEGRPVHVYRTCEYLKDMGTPERFKQVEEDIASGLFARMSADHKRPCIFFDRDGVLTKDVPEKGVTQMSELELLPQAAQAVQLANKKGFLCVLVTNQPQIAKGFISYAELDALHAKLETLLGEKSAWLDRIYFCPHHPKSGFPGEVPELKRECDCRKPRPGMLQAALQELPIDKTACWMIGDTRHDVGAARAMGIPALGVRTGMGCRDCGGDQNPDQMFDDVGEAVNFICP